jgi:membrane associated rhomboid family serine protease
LPNRAEYGFSIPSARGWDLDDPDQEEVTVNATDTARRILPPLVVIAFAVWAAGHLSSVGASWSAAWRLLTGLSWEWLVGLAGGVVVGFVGPPWCWRRRCRGSPTAAR